jgi:ribosomal-protein-alanine N-acetyltransferase
MNSEDLQIRGMTRGDLDRVIEIAQSLKESPHWPRDAYLAALDPEGMPQRVAFVATKVAGAVVGFAVASLLPPQAELEMIAVVAEEKRRGVARRLFEELANEIRRAHVTEIILEVRASNYPAIGLYRSLGFRQVGCRPAYYADPVEDAVLMSEQIAT